MKKNAFKILKNLAKTYSKEELSAILNSLYPETKPQSLKECYVGCFAFENNLFSDKPNTFDGLFGIVVDVDNAHHGIIMTFDELFLSYGDAEKYCRTYHEHNVPIGYGFMADEYLWRKIFVHNRYINFALKKANQKILSDSYWCRTPNYQNTAFVINALNARYGYDSTLNKWKVRCFIKF